MALPPYAMLDALHRGRGSAEILTALSEHALFSELLTERGHGPDSPDAVYCAQHALVDASVRGSSSDWTLPVDKYQALTRWLSHYVGQLEHAGLQGILSAHAALSDFLAKRTIEMKAAV
ncbi:hypothetical protein WJ87_07250 [Burkholderia ubonensis]|nr:hypothetical protein WJ87_07250 [Burkholderia ubonensis]